MNIESGNQNYPAAETKSPASVHYCYGREVIYRTTKGGILSKEEARSRLREAPRVLVHYVIAGKDRLIDRVEIDE